MPGKHWTRWEVVRLKAFINKGLATSEIAFRKRTKASVHGKAVRLHLVGDGIRRRPWPRKDEQKLRWLVAQKTPVPVMIQIEDGLSGYSACAVRTKISRLKLADPDRSQRVRNAVHFTPQELADFHRFLRLWVDMCPPEQMAIFWNEGHSPRVSAQKVRYHLTHVLHINKPRWRVLQMQFSKNKRGGRSKEAILSQKLRWISYRRRMRREFKLLYSQLAQGKSHIRTRICEDCGSRWPRRQPFFPSMRKQTKKGWRTYFSRCCRLCVNKKRRNSRPKQQEARLLNRQAS